MTSEAEPTAAGWDAIDAACQHLYGEQVPRHVGYTPGRTFGTVLQGCSAYRAEDHWHYVTYGLSNIFDEDEGDERRLQRLGLRADVARARPGWRRAAARLAVRHPPAAREVGSRRAPLLLEEGTRLHIGGPVTGFPHTDGPDTNLTGILVATDPPLGQISTVNGRVTLPAVRRRRCR